MQRKHEGFERDLAALGDKVNSLGETAERLIQSHPESAEDLQEKCTELNQAWNSLGKRADQRKAKLGDSHDLQRFLSDFRYKEYPPWGVEPCQRHFTGNVI